jgi:hypothetical protein
VIGQPEPEPGMGATILAWTDRYAATIIGSLVGPATRGATIILVQVDRAIRTDKNGLSEDQTYTYEPNTNGTVYFFRKTKVGTWEEVAMNPRTGRYNKNGGLGLRIGEREEYRDFSF